MTRMYIRYFPAFPVFKMLFRRFNFMACIKLTIKAPIPTGICAHFLCTVNQAVVDPVVSGKFLSSRDFLHFTHRMVRLSSPETNMPISSTSLVSIIRSYVCSFSVPFPSISLVSSAFHSQVPEANTKDISDSDCVQVPSAAKLQVTSVSAAIIA